MAREGFARGHQHLIGNARRAGGDHAQTNTREDIGVVALGNRIGFILPYHRIERAAGRNQRVTFGPGDDVLRRRFHAGGRVGKRHHDRALAVLVHLTNNLFREEAGLSGNADQNIRLHVAHHVQQGEDFVVSIPVFQVLAFLHQFGLERQQVRHTVGQQAETVNHKHAGAGQLFTQAFTLRLGNNLFGDTASCGACPEEDDFLIAQLAAGCAAGGDKRTHGHGCGALDIVVKGADLIAIAVQQRHRVLLRKVFELQQHVRPAVFHGLDEIVDKLVVLFVGNTRMTPAHIQGIVQQLLVIGAHIQHHRQGIRRADAATGGVE